MTTEWLPRNCFLSSRHRFPRHLQCPTFRDILASIDSKKLRTQMHLWKDAGVQLHAMLPGKIMKISWRYHEVHQFRPLDFWNSCNMLQWHYHDTLGIRQCVFVIFLDSFWFFMCFCGINLFSSKKHKHTRTPPKNMHGSWASRRCELAIRLFVHHSEGIKSHFTLNWHLLRQIATGSTQQTILFFLSFLNQDQLTSMRSPCIVCTWWTQ